MIKKIGIWVGIVLGIVSIEALIFDQLWDHFWQPKPTQVVDLLRSTSYTRRRSLTDLTKRLFHINDVHETKLLTNSLAQSAISLADLAHSITYVEQYMRDHHIEFHEIENSIDGMNVAFSMAKILVYEAAGPEKRFAETKSRIQYWLDKHKEIAEQKDPEKVKYNYLLRGQYFKSLAYELISINKQEYDDEIQSNVNQAVEMFGKATEVHGEHHPEGIPWTIPTTSEGHLYENLFVFFGDETYLLKAWESSSKIMPLIPEITVDSKWDHVLLNYNAAEKYLWRYDYIACRKKIKKSLVWFDGRKDILKHENQESTLYRAFIALDVMCDMFELHERPNKLKQKSKDAIMDRIRENRLDLLEYSGAMIRLMRDILSCQYHHINKDKRLSQAIVAQLVGQVRSDGITSSNPNVSGPLTILKILEQSILDKNMTDYPKVYDHTLKKTLTI